MLFRSFASQRGVPLDHVESQPDAALAREAGRILAAYTERRERMSDAATIIRELTRLNRRFESSAMQAAEIAAQAYDSEPLTIGGARDAVLDAG